MSLSLAIRSLRRAPWYSATVISTVGLSIALASTVFAVVDGVLFKPLPYPEAAWLFHLAGSSGGPSGTASLSPADVRYLNAADARISVTGFGGSIGLTHPDRPELPIWSAAIDDRFFDVLGQHPLIGGFDPDAYQQPPSPDQPRVAIVSYAFWRQWLGSDPATVGRIVDMVGTRLKIAGVLPRDFVFPEAFGRVRPDVLLPFVPSPEASLDRWSRTLNAAARVEAPLSLEEANRLLDAALAVHATEYSPREVRPGPYVAVAMIPLEQYLGRNERPLFWLAFAATGLLVVLGAINVAGLIAARGRDREREFTIRAALGASRGQLARLTLAEALAIAVTGSALGLALTRPLLSTTLTMLPERLLLLKPPVIDWRVVVFAIATACGVVVTFAVVPALTLARSALASRLSAAGTTTPRARSWGRSAILVVESALGIALVVAGSLALASFVVLRSADPGFDSEGLAILDVRTIGAASAAEAQSRLTRILERLRQSPGVSAVATVGVPLLENMFGGSQFARPAGGVRFFASDVPISGRFFEVARLRLLEGRVLTEQEIEGGRPLAVVSDLTARAYWPESGAVGQTLTSKDGTVTIVGIVEEARFGAQDEMRQGEIYLPAGLASRGWITYLLRTSGDPAVVAKAAAAALQRELPGVFVRRAESFDEALAKSVRLYSFRTVLFGVAAAAALLLLAAGIGGLVATGVSRRVREIGIRTALGAPRRQLVAMVIMDHLRPSLAGVAIGLIASWWITRLLNAFLYEIDAHEPLVWLAAVLTVVLVSIIAAWIPARRASGLDAMTILKAE